MSDSKVIIVKYRVLTQDKLNKIRVLQSKSNSVILLVSEDNYKLTKKVSQPEKLEPRIYHLF